VASGSVSGFPGVRSELPEFLRGFPACDCVFPTCIRLVQKHLVASQRAIASSRPAITEARTVSRLPGVRTRPPNVLREFPESKRHVLKGKREVLSNNAAPQGTNTVTFAVARRPERLTRQLLDGTHRLWARTRRLSGFRGVFRGEGIIWGSIRIFFDGTRIACALTRLVLIHVCGVEAGSSLFPWDFDGGGLKN
jgi:hypothetical protein